MQYEHQLKIGTASREHLSFPVLFGIAPECHLKKDVTFSSSDGRLHRQREPSLELISQFLHILILTRMNQPEHQNSGFLIGFYARLESVAEEKHISTINLKSFNYLKSIGRLTFTENRHLTPILQDMQMTPMLQNHSGQFITPFPVV